MVYTEVQIKNGKRYYYRTKTVRKGKKFKKIRKYLGKGLTKEELKKREREVDKLLVAPLTKLLTRKEENALKEIKIRYTKQSKKNYQNRYEYFITQFTYDTNAIEGSTLTLRDTALILFDKITPSGKTLREVNEAINHKKAFDYMLEYKEEINKKFICRLQEIITENTLKSDLKDQIGVYRKVQVRIAGADFIPPPPNKVEDEMKSLLSWHHNHKKRLHPLTVAAYFHSAFESIHPFVDGNGRTGRLIINFTLHRNGYPMINIPNKRRGTYYSVLEDARKGNLRSLVKFLLDILMSTSYSI